LQASLKSSSRAHLRVAVVAVFDAVERPDKDTDSTVRSEKGIPTSTAHKRAHSEVKTPSITKKQRETATTHQRATEAAIEAVIDHHIINISRQHKCDRASCTNVGHPCYNLPIYGHVKLTGAHLRDWNQGIRDDSAVGIHHPPPTLLQRMILDKQAELNRKQLKAVPEAVSTAIPSLAGSGINLNFNLSGAGMPGWPQQSLPPGGQADSEARDREPLTPAPSTPSMPPPTPSSPIPAAVDEDTRLAAFIRSRIRNRPAQRREFERAMSVLTSNGVGFSDIARLTIDEWREMGIQMGIRMDLLKNDKIWHLQNPESVDEVVKAVSDELETQQSVENNDSQLQCI
jgi:hypothetical protein